jgi:hypothetical protein
MELMLEVNPLMCQVRSYHQNGHLRIDLIGRRVRNEDSGLTAGIPIGLHQRKMELSNHG